MAKAARGKKATKQRVAVKAKVTPRSKAKTKARPAKRVAASKKAAASKPAAAAMSRIGLITHTELASANPPATKAWCQKVLGWKFMPSMPTPGGPYHMWRSQNDTGGGIRSNSPPELPGTIPYCEVKSIEGSYKKALAAGAVAMVSPMEIPGGMGWIAIVKAPGGVPIGFWAMS